MAEHAMVYALAGAALLLAVILPTLTRRSAVSAPVVLVVVGALAGLLPLPAALTDGPVLHHVFVEHLTEFTVLVALMGVGLALDRPLSLRSWSTWRRWGTTWRLIAFGLPLCFAATALLTGWWLPVAPAAAVLVAAVLTPTDPVLASDLQVAGPTTGEDAAEIEEVDERDEVRFALTSEAGLNDGLAFPFVAAAIALTTLDLTSGGIAGWLPGFLGWHLVGKVVLGVASGVAVGWLLGLLAFRAPRSMRTSHTGEPLLALAAVLLSYGVAETVHGYGFVSAFCCGMALRAGEREHDYQVDMHHTIEELERLLTLVVLLLLGVSLTNGLLASLTPGSVGVALALVLLLRPLTAWIALRVGPGAEALDSRERLVTAFFGVRGVGSLFYLAYATGHADFGDHELLWSTVGLAITASVVLHGLTGTAAMSWLERHRDREPPDGGATEPG